MITATSELQEAKKACVDFIQTMNEHTDKQYYALKSFIVLNLWLWHADVFPTSGPQESPLGPFIRKLREGAELLTRSSETGFNVNHYPEESFADVVLGDPAAYESNMGSIFSDIWLDMTDDIYFDQCLKFTQDRYEKNDVNPFELFKGKVVLDAGSGSGKVTSAIAKFGAAKVTGLDIGEKGLKFAEAQSHKFVDGKNITYVRGSLLDIPFKESTFDIVHSNGVVHHTANFEKALSELARVLKPGGTLFIFVMGRSGLFELLADTLRTVCVQIPRHFFQHYLRAVGMNSGRIYWTTDHCYARYEWKSKADFEALLRKNGFHELKQFTRGISIDQTELITTKAPYAELKYGEGQLKYLAVKNG